MNQQSYEYQAQTAPMLPSMRDSGQFQASEKSEHHETIPLTRFSPVPSAPSIDQPNRYTSTALTSTNNASYHPYVHTAAYNVAGHQGHAASSVVQHQPVPGSHMPIVIGSTLCPPPQPSVPPSVPPPSYESVVHGSEAAKPQSIPPVFAKDQEVVKEEDNTGCSCCKCMFSFVGHVGFFVCLLLLVWDYMWPSGDSERFTACLICLIVSYLIALIETCCSDTCTYVHNYVSIHDLTSYVHTMKGAPPKITWTVNCYHYETKYRPVTEKDSTGHARYESYEERVETHSEEREFLISRWRDNSSALPDFGEGEIIRLHFHKSFKFVDDSAESMYESRKEEFKQSNIDRDKFMDFSERFEMGETFQERMTAAKDEDSRSVLMEPCLFWLCSLLLLTWCYRFWFKTMSRKYHFTFVKEIID